MIDMSQEIEDLKRRMEDLSSRLEKLEPQVEDVWFAVGQWSSLSSFAERLCEKVKKSHFKVCGR